MKKILFCSIAILLAYQTTKAQDKSEKNDKEKKTPSHKTLLALGLTASPDYYIYDFKNQPGLRFSYKSSFNYSLGITAIYHPVKFISLRASLLYSQKGYSLDYNYAVSTPGVVPTSSELGVAYLDIPLMIHLNLIHKDMVQLYLSAGLVPGIMFDKIETTVFSDNSQSNSTSMSEHLNTFLAGTTYSIGFKYNLSPSLGLGIDPYFRYYLNKIDREAMGDNPISFGAKFALLINILHKHHRNKFAE